MTRLSLWLARGLAATFLFVLNTYAISAIALAQDGAANPPSRYAPAAGAKPVTKTQPPASSRPVYGPAAPKSSGAPPQRAIRQAADEQPLEQPARTNRPQQQPTGPDAAPQAEPLPPEWHPLDLQVQQWTDSVLAKWEEKSQGIIRYECKFRSWKYDTVFGPADPNIPKLISEGTIRYANPDKGEFRTEKLQKCKLPLAPGVKPVYEIPKVRNPDSDKDEPEVGDHWVCDGKSIYIYDNVKRIVTQLMLPAAMRDKPITEGPIPFLFGTKAAQINARYWIRPAPEKPATAKDEYWLEAVPKYRADQENFQKVRVILDGGDYLPKAIVVYEPNYEAKKNPARTYYQFNERRPAFKGDPLVKLSEMTAWIRGNFIAPKIPLGWKKVVENAEPVSLPGGGESPGQAKRPPGEGPAKTR